MDKITDFEMLSKINEIVNNTDRWEDTDLLMMYHQIKSLLDLKFENE